MKPSRIGELIILLKVSKGGEFWSTLFLKDMYPFQYKEVVLVDVGKDFVKLRQWIWIENERSFLDIE